MIEQKKFIYDFFDGQIVKDDSGKYKLFKLIMFLAVTIFGLVCTIIKLSNVVFFVLVELGMIWNFYLKINEKLSIVFCVIVSAIYFVIACNFRFYSNALMYVGFYIPFQMFATTKTYYGGTFVQIKKEMSDVNQIIFIIMAVFLSVVFYMFDLAFMAKFAALDAASAGCLVASAILRNERYNDYYYFRVIGLLLNISLWTYAYIEYNNFGLILIAVLYLSYLVFDVVTNVVQKNTYENEYMQIVKKYKEKENEKIVNEKLKAYNGSNK